MFPLYIYFHISSRVNWCRLIFTRSLLYDDNIKNNINNWRMRHDFRPSLRITTSNKQKHTSVLDSYECSAKTFSHAHTSTKQDRSSFESTISTTISTTFYWVRVRCARTYPFQHDSSTNPSTTLVPSQFSSFSTDRPNNYRVFPFWRRRARIASMSVCPSNTSRRGVDK